MSVECPLTAHTQIEHFPLCLDCQNLSVGTNRHADARKSPPRLRGQDAASRRPKRKTFAR